ncbi:N-acetylglucosaminyl-phosphatidylinositol de-N-acetylase [Erysiphe neolycopersici]|uniref:N-acetylglucosaminylphosphatidylinositol deacetylase n=1 Tax=Erysiphe neolycopersici TaxID=212602 RepID=A0A420HGG8_9PEZI|nr:N-acetylglucosaminyl-phosphatidylinositol de-N-acetylase [Erysiphe neolycopersici]
MFFAPTVLALTRSSLGNHVKILCLSSGNSEGLGEIRKKELIKSGLKLGLRKEDDIIVIDNQQDFPDSMIARWDETKVAALLLDFFAPNFGRWSQEASDAGYRAAIDVLITFDSGGISRHPNHISLYHGAKKFISSLDGHGLHWASPVSLYTLTSLSMIRKYTFIFDILPSTVDVALSKMKKVGNARDHPTHLIFLNGPEQLRCAQFAMKFCHQSQMKWYRQGWIIFSRYMAINDLRLEQHVGH